MLAQSECKARPGVKNLPQAKKSGLWESPPPPYEEMSTYAKRGVQARSEDARKIDKEGSQKLSHRKFAKPSQAKPSVPKEIMNTRCVVAGGNQAST